ncbi:MAG: pilus assembly protein TadG-related protein [Syntrophomonas sp.]|nr:pilus assembly protein TadG-related protein [Syntrophomonas sp.]
MKKISEFLRNEKGTVVVVLAIAMSVLAGFTALVTDVGFKYFNEAKLVNALDSAVLAGVQELPADPQLALEQAVNYADLNGILGGESSFQVDVSNRSVSGTANRQLGLFFARVLGFETTQVSASSKARIAPISSTGGIVPFGVIKEAYTFGQEVTLKEGAGDQSYSGWFGALRLGGTGALVYRDNIKYGYPEIISIGDVLEIESGNMSGPTRAGIEYRLDECHHVPQCSINSYVHGCSRILIVPMVNIEDINEGGHPASVRVVGFAAFLVNEYIGNGQESNVVGYFINYVASGTTSENGSDFGLYGSQLCE